MIFDTKTFHALENGYNAAWLQMQASQQNLANYETPNYKAKYVKFDDLLKNAVKSDDPSYAFSTKLETDTTTKVREDGNNVDSDAESMRLYKAYVQYSYLTNKISGQFTNLSYVLNNAFKG